MEPHIHPERAVKLTIDQLLERCRSELDRLTPEQARKAQRGGAWLIDTRSPDQIEATGAIPGAICASLSVLEWRLDPASEWRLDPAPDLDEHVVLVCKEGYSSSLAAHRLQQLGFERATDMIGGFEAWEEAGLPVESPKRHPDATERRQRGRDVLRDTLGR